jgi:V8-like Glu-specific endopeptidase
MISRASLLITISVALAFVYSSKILAQDISTLKSGVVRIQNSKSDEVGTGFVIKVNGNQAYIITAAHVVKGDQHPSVYLFNQQHDALQSEVLDREDDDTKGLALLRLKLSSRIASGITALKLSYTSQLDGGEDIKVIGFPDSTAFWTVGSGSIARIEGRNLVFSGAVRGGNSGGPVIFNGLVIGMVTDVSQAAAYAARGEVIETYANGIVANLISVSTAIITRPANNSASNDNLCVTLNMLLDASKGGFYSIVGDPINSENTFKSKIVMPDAIDGYIRPPKEAHYRFLIEKDKGKVENLFYTYVTRVRGCLPKHSCKIKLKDVAL